MIQRILHFEKAMSMWDSWDRMLHLNVNCPQHAAMFEHIVSS